ncbi:hypothetical protein D915_008795 [Fasciola hepatica]|uniref:Uncharacterized protein n=1 Tax=Fasciola hepatica TaxID=6192 RepID=A0A4E0R2R1_FASHE|nr:hypothetical protein D915_008795 [Fasciola hepatica]
METRGFRCRSSARTKLMEDRGNMRSVNQHDGGFSTEPKETDTMPFHYVDSEVKMDGTALQSRKPTIADEHLGYDWIAAMLDNQKCYGQTDDDQSTGRHWLNHSGLFDQIAKFRQTNYEACHSQNSSGNLSVYQPDRPFQKEHISPSSRIRNRIDHLRPVRSGVKNTKNLARPPEIYSYTLNTRLFPIPSDMATAKRLPPQPGQDHILRVTVPLHYFRHPSRLLQKIISARGESSELERSPQRSNPWRSQSPKPGTMSLNDHCYPPKNGPRISRTICSKVYSPDESILTISGFSGGLVNSFVTEDGTILPGWVRFLPQNEKEAIALLLRKKPVSWVKGIYGEHGARSETKQDLCIFNTKLE